MLQPMLPPPMITTSASCGTLVDVVSRKDLLHGMSEAASLEDSNEDDTDDHRFDQRPAQRLCRWVRRPVRMGLFQDAILTTSLNFHDKITVSQENKLDC